MGHYLSKFSLRFNNNNTINFNRQDVFRWTLSVTESLGCKQKKLINRIYGTFKNKMGFLSVILINMATAADAKNVFVVSNSAEYFNKTAEV